MKLWLHSFKPDETVQPQRAQEDVFLRARHAPQPASESGQAASEWDSHASRCGTGEASCRANKATAPDPVEMLNCMSVLPALYL